MAQGTNQRPGHGRSCARVLAPRRLAGLIACLSGISLVLLPAGAGARAGSDLVAIGKAPALPSGTVRLAAAAVASSTPLKLTVALRPRDPSALSAYALAVSKPGSADFRQFLSPGQFARRFAPATAATARIAAALRARGLTVGRASANGLSLPVRGSVADVERAFSLGLAHVALRDGTRALVNTSAPRLPESVAGLVQAVIGLSSLDSPQPSLVRPSVASRQTARAKHVATGGPQPCAAASAAAPQQAAYTDDQIASAYGFSGLYHAGDEGRGVTVAVYELESDDPADIAAYQSCYGTDAEVSYDKVDGGAGTGPGSGEAALDIEQLIGLAPKVHVLVYQGPNSNSDSPGSGPYDTYSAIVGQDAASVISTSWGQCEPMEGQPDASAEETLFEEAAVQGQTVVSAAGDSGSEDCLGQPPSLPNTQLAVDDPASDPYVTGVGGTSLSAIGPPPTETTWNNGGNATDLFPLEGGAGGGGISALWPMPAYQADAPAGLGVIQADSSGSPCGAGSSPCREVPDVSADADPNTGYLIYYNGSGEDPTAPSGWQGTGGTSGSAPLWASLIALADAQASCGASPIGFANPVLYRLAGEGESTYFHDITSGNNDFTGTGGGKYPAQAGYDMATGLGSPDGAALAPALCSQTLRLITPNAQRTFLGQAARLSVDSSDASGSGLHLSASGLPRGLTLNATSGQITGKPGAAGVFHVTVTAIDHTGAARVARFTWTVDRKPRTSAVRLGGVSARAPTLSLTVSSGTDEPVLRSIALTLPAGLALRSLRDVKVSAAHGGSLKSSLRNVGGRLQITMPQGTGSVRLVLDKGSLRVSSSLIAAARHHSRLTLGLATTDSGSQRATLTASLRA